MIRAIYRDVAPSWPASDNHPSAIRYQKTLGGVTVFVDAVGSEPTNQECIDLLSPPTAEQVYDSENSVYRVLRSLVICLNNGTFVPNSSYTANQIKTILKANLP